MRVETVQIAWHVREDGKNDPMLSADFWGRELLATGGADAEVKVRGRDPPLRALQPLTRPRTAAHAAALERSGGGGEDSGNLRPGAGAAREDGQRGPILAGRCVARATAWPSRAHCGCEGASPAGTSRARSAGPQRGPDLPWPVLAPEYSRAPRAAGTTLASAGDGVCPRMGPFARVAQRRDAGGGAAGGPDCARGT